ncbi:MAG: M36 family metallopeptidase [Ferruginibacter sp.]
MKKFLFFIMAFLFVQSINAQSFDAEKSAALQLVNANQSALGLSSDDVNNLMVSVSYTDKNSGIRYAYLQQTFKGIPVYNQMQVVTFRNNSVLSNAGGRIKNIGQKVTNPGGTPSLAAESAVMAAISDRKLSTTQFATVISKKQNGREVEFGNLGVSRENITAHLVWVPSVTNPNEVALAWQVYIVSASSSDYWLVRIDANSGRTLGVDNLTVYCNWDDPNHHLMHVMENNGHATAPLLLNIGNAAQVLQSPTSPTLADNATYRVIPIPYEAPSFMPGAPSSATVTNPWTAGSANATTLKWHSTDATGTDYNYTRGNNVWAYHDRLNQNVGDPTRSATSTTALPNLSFDFVPDYTQPPINTTPPNQQFNITNLFYANNIIHDIMYNYGFDEAGGNFQDNNLGRGGLGNDHVNAEAQDGSGTNNANFATPVDGGSGRMQMYLWTLSTPQRDGDVDNGIIFHEFGHGISNRLTGGPGNSSCLQNAEQMGEGWSDYYSLMLTQDWATSNLNTGFTSPRGIGTYALNQPTTGVGIRSQKYCTDFTVNNKVYAASIPSSPHDRGEIWCATLWDMTWNIIQQEGVINPNIYNLAGGGGNTIAMKLVTEGMKLQPCSPGFIDGRDAIIQADNNLYGGAHLCAIKEAFRRRGMGEGASQGSSFSVTDQVPSFTGASTVFTQQPQSTTACAGSTVSFTVAATGSPSFTYQWQVSTNGGGTWTNIAGATTATYSFTCAAGDNGKQYRCAVSSSCGATNSSAATLTITTLSNGGSITPAIVNACSATNSTTLTLTGFVGNIIQWEYSADGGTTWTVVANTTNTLTVTNLTQTRIYRAQVQSTGCSASYSAISTINYIASGVGPLVITADNGTTLCAGDPTLLTALSAAPGTVTVSSGPISVAIPDGNAAGTSTSLTVSGVPATAVGSSASVLFNISHTWDGDLTLFLKAPNNQVLNLVNQRGGSADNFVNTVISSTATTPIASGAAPFTGTFLPDGNTGAPAPTGFTPTATTFAPLYATAGQLNGVWSFGARDVASLDAGTITSWSLTLNYNSLSNNPGLTYVWTPAAGLNATNINPVAASPNTTTTYTVTATNGTGCTSQASVTITINQRPAVTTQPAATSVCDGTAATFTVAASGTGITYQWQESANGGTTWTTLSNGGAYSGVNTPTLTVNPVTAAMNNYRYRCVISGICTPAANSNGAVLTVKALPTVTVTPTSGCGGIAGINGLALNASGGNTYVWSPTAGLYTDATATTAYTGTSLATVYAAPTAFTSYTVTGTNTASGCSNTATALINYTPFAPSITPNPVSMCLGDNAVMLRKQPGGVYPFTSGTINLSVPDNNTAGVTSNIAVSGVPTSGITITDVTVGLNMTHTWDGDMVFVLKAPNGKILNLAYYLSGTGGAGATSGFTNTRISSTGVNALSTGTNPYNGIFKADAVLAGAFGPAGPNGNLPNTQLWSDLTPLNTINGTWTLGMYDGGPADLGVLTSWNLNFSYVFGVPSTAPIWSPVAGLYNDAAATSPYVAGTRKDTVYAKPTPSGVYNYLATVNSLPPASTPISTNFASGNGNYVITFNFRNSNNYPVTITDIASLAFAAGQSNVSAYYNATNIAGSPGAITAANGWIQFGSATITATGGSTVDPFMSGLSLVIPANTTYRLLVRCATTAGGFNMGYSTLAAGVYTFTANGCSIITGDNIGYGGPDIPGVPANTPRGFIGTVRFAPGAVAACTSPATTVTVTVNQPLNVTAQPVNAAVCTDKVTTFSATVTGTNPGHNWQYSASNGNPGTWVTIANGGVFSGAKTATLTITAPPVSMNGYVFRDSITAAAPCPVTFSNMARLTVNPLPTIVISASPYTKLFPGLKTTLTATVSPAAAAGGYRWLRNGAQVGGSTSTLVADIDMLGTYTLQVTDVNGCTNLSNSVLLSDSLSGKVFIYPTPNNGQFQVRYYSIINNAGLPRGINIYDARGKRILTNTYSIGAPYQRMDVDLRNHGAGVYWVEVVDVNGDRLAVGRTEVLR